MINKEDLIIELSVISDRQYGVIKLEDTQRSIDFEINMIRNNPSMAFLDIELRQVNDDRKLMYAIGRKQNLREYLDNNISNIDTVIDIIISVFNTLKTSREYMLDNRKIILDSKNIFIDKDSTLPYMIYVPLEMEFKYTIEDELKIFIKEIVGKLKKYKKRFNSYQKDIVNVLNSGNVEWDMLDEAFEKYKNQRSDFYIAEKEKKDVSNIIDTDSDIYEEETSHKVSKERIKNKNNNNNISREPVIEKKTSVIEENYDEFEDLEDEEDETNYDELNYKEHKEMEQYEKLSKNNKTNKILVMQLIVVMLIGSLVLVLSFDDKQFFIMMASIMGFVVLLCVLLLILNINKKK